MIEIPPAFDAKTMGHLVKVRRLRVAIDQINTAAHAGLTHTLLGFRDRAVGAFLRERGFIVEGQRNGDKVSWGER